MLIQTLHWHQYWLSLVIIFLMTIQESVVVVVANDLQLDQIVNLKNTGGIGCILTIHPDVDACKSQYTKRMTDVVDKGHEMTSPEYRKAMCCGFWSLRNCVADMAKDKCDTKAAKQISNMKIYSSEHENVLAKNCDGYEYGSKQCDSTASLSLSTFTLITGLIVFYIVNR